MVEPRPALTAVELTDSREASLSVANRSFRESLASRLGDLRPELGADEAHRLAEIVSDTGRAAEPLRDVTSTRLMEAFRLQRGRGAFGLLYELNCEHVLVQVAARLRRFGSKADPHDVLQEVFFNIYRYPHRFNAERDDAFRVWSARIVHNTVLKHLRSNRRTLRSEIAIDELSEPPETASNGPLGGAIERESREECAQVYMTYLHLYLRFYAMLSERERHALRLVEVEERSYRQAAEELGIKLENLKMVIFRARRKIHRAMRRVFDGMSPDCRPAREPRVGARDAVQETAEIFADDQEVES